MTYLRQGLAGLRMLLLFTVITGLLYPLAVWTVSRLPGLRDNAEGSIITANGRPVGSELIGIDPVPADPEHDPWFHTRPSALSAGPLGPADPGGSAASNYAADNPGLVALIQQRRDVIAARENVVPDRVPADAVTASASGLDPHISPAYAALQASRVASENGVSPQRLRVLIADHTTGRGLGVLGDPAVNVLQLNLAVQAARSAG